jgi:glycosyltransferase involved in cell wall biosynthesis
LLSLHQGGGAGSVYAVLQLGLRLARRGVAVHLVCPPDSEVERAARAGGLEVHPVPLARGGRVGNAAVLRDLLAGLPVDLVNSHGSRDREALTWLRLTGRVQVPMIFTRQSFPRTTALETWLASLAATRVVAVSQTVAEALRRLGTPARKLDVIRNGVLLDRLDRPVPEAEVREWKARIGWQPSRRTIAVVARPKDQMVVVQALARVATPVSLVLAGLDGDLLSGTLPPVPARHVVVRLPFLADVRGLYELVELALHPSRWDALPNAVLEAMALGKPVIASRATGNAEIVRDELDGLLVEPLDAAAWATAIDRVLGDPALASRLGTAAGRRALKDFPFERTVDETLALYRRTLARAAPG